MTKLFLLVLVAVVTMAHAGITYEKLEQDQVFRNTATVRITLGASNLPFLEGLNALDILEAYYDRLDSDEVRSMALAQSFSHKADVCQWNVVAGKKALYMADRNHGYVTLNVTPITDPNISPENSEIVPETNADNFYLFSSAKEGKICSY